MSNVKRDENENASNEVLSVSIRPEDRDWAAKQLGFDIGRSAWSDRAKAIVKHLGGLGRAEAETGIPEGTWRTWQNRGSRPRNVMEIAAKIGVSPAYLDSGKPEIALDFDVEVARLALARAAEFPAGGSSSPLRRQALRELLEQLRSDIERARFSADLGAVTSRQREPAAGLSDEADSLFAPPRLTITLGLPGLADGDAAPFGFSRDWLARQRLDPADLGMVDLQSSWQLVDLSQTARQLVDGCTYVVHDSGAGRFVFCRWRREDRALVLSDGRAFELERHLRPEAVVGRVVYAVTPV